MNSAEVAYVTAKQTVGTVPVVTVNGVAADDAVMPAAYTLTLPAGAPLLGSYSTPPIMLTAQPTLAGQYSVEASAIGYTAQSFAKDVSAVNATQSFALVP